MAILTVTPQVLSDASQELSALAGEIKTITDSMHQLVEELKESWKDEVGQTFIKRFETEVAEKFSNYYGEVDEYSAFIKGAHDKYVATIENLKRTVNATAPAGTDMRG